MSETRDHCTLSDEQYAARRKQLRESLLPLVRRREKLGNGLALFFEPTVTMRSDLEAFVEFERECCPGLSFEVSNTGKALRLEILGVDPSASEFAEVEAAVVQAQPSSSSASSAAGWRSVARSLGIGGTLAILVCCILPIGVAALVGATVAAPLVALDNPLAIAAAGLVFAFLLWRRERRQSQAATVAATSGGCGC